MAMKKKPGRSKVEVGIPSTEAVFSAGNNNASGSLIANLATQNRAELAYELREIALQDIELNPDNAIFRQLDTDEDVETIRRSRDAKWRSIRRNFNIGSLKGGDHHE